jgi:hypothetical protein
VTFSTCGIISVNILQVHLISGETSTGHKLQGDSLEQLMIVDYGTTGYRRNKDGWLYVMFSRALSLEGIFIVQPLPLNVQGFQERNDFNQEMFLQYICTDNIMHAPT